MVKSVCSKAIQWRVRLGFEKIVVKFFLDIKFKGFIYFYSLSVCKMCKCDGSFGIFLFKCLKIFHCNIRLHIDEFQTNAVDYSSDITICHNA